MVRTLSQADLHCSGKYTVIGVLKKKGSGFNSSDNLCIIPYTNVRQYFPAPSRIIQSISHLRWKHLPEAAEGYSEGLFPVSPAPECY